MAFVGLGYAAASGGMADGEWLMGRIGPMGLIGPMRSRRSVSFDRYLPRNSDSGFMVIAVTFNLRTFQLVPI